MEKHKDYYAFISYKREDERMAKWLQHKLEHYKLPSNLNGRTDLPRSIRPIFRDATELTPGNLPQQIHDALEASQHLIVICSPRSAQSYWVNKEIETFIAMGKQDNIIPYIIDGQPFAEDVDDECFPPAIRNMPKEKEILGANVNEMGQNAAAVKTVAKMLGVRFDSLWKRYEREQKTKRLLMILAVALFVVAVLGVATWIWSQNNDLKENISRVAANKALELVEEGNCYLARKVAQETYGIAPTNEAERALRKACRFDNAILEGHTRAVKTVSFSPDGKRIVSGSGDETIRIWDATTGKELETLEGHTAGVTSVSFSPDGKRIVSGSSDNTIRIWDATTGKEFETLKGHTADVETVSFSPDGKRIVSGSWDNTIRIWDATTGKELETLEGHTRAVKTVSFSPDGKRIVSGSWDETIRIWDATTGKELETLEGHTNIVYSVSFSPDGKRIVSGSSDRTIRIWDATTGKELEILEGHTGGVSSVSFSPDGKLIVSNSYDRTIRIWDFPPLQELIDKTREQFKDYPLTPEERRKYYLE